MAIINKNAGRSFYALALARIFLGFVFLWAFADKLFGLGLSTCRDKLGAVHAGCSQAWLHGGSPTKGFLTHATSGPLHQMYVNLGTNHYSLIDWLFMLGLLVVGLGLILGVFIRLTTVIGAVMLLLMWSSLLWPDTNPFVDEHIVYIFVLATINLANSQQRWGLHDKWVKTSLVQKVPLLE
jgi:thiosulfate dehydrogenase [quinone] large subunit